MVSAGVRADAQKRPVIADPVEFSRQGSRILHHTTPSNISRLWSDELIAYSNMPGVHKIESHNVHMMKEDITLNN